MTLEFDRGSLYTVVLRCRQDLIDDEAISFSDLEFVAPGSFDEFQEVTLADLEFAGRGYFEWAAEPVLVFVDQSESPRSGEARHRVFRESEIVTVERA